MKRIVPALALGLLTFAGCTDFRSDVFIKGRFGPDPASPPGLCEYKPPSGSGTLYLDRTEVNPLDQQIAYNKLDLTVGLDVQNDTATPDVPNANGASTSQPNRDDAQVQAVDITLTDLQNNELATETVVASGYIPAGGNGAVLVDVMGQPLADYLRKSVTFPNVPPAEEQLLLSIVVRGKLVSGTDFETEPFQHQFQVDHSYTLQEQVGDLLQVTTVLDNGSIADAVVLPDGGLQLGIAVQDTTPGGASVQDAGGTADWTLREETDLAVPDGGATFGPPTCE